MNLHSLTASDRNALRGASLAVAGEYFYGYWFSHGRA